MFRWRSQSNENNTICLALQGGGSHGAFVWGVLDSLLEDQRLGVEGISGTSSGAINGALVANGLAEEGREGARRRLAAFWHAISEACHRRRRSWFAPQWFWRKGRFDLSSKGVFFDVMARMLLPYDFNPFNMNPLRHAIAETIDFDCLRASDSIKLFVNATNIRTNKNRVFTNGDISVDAICASSCLPFLFHPVEIDGQHYWDGGYMGNPAIYPLMYNCESSDIVLVQTNPVQIKDPPCSAGQILERISAISFTSVLMREMRAIKLISELMEEGHIKRRAGLRPIRMHMIEAADELGELDGTSRFHADRVYLDRLYELGRRTGSAWLEKNFDKIGRAPTLDIEETFL